MIREGLSEISLAGKEPREAPGGQLSRQASTKALGQEGGRCI